MILGLMVATARFATSAELSDSYLIDKKSYNEIMNSINLSNKELSRYKEAFALSNKNQWKSLDKQIAKINNDALMGHILAQKYLSKDYISTNEELEEWLEKFSDYPQYNQIYKLAIRKGSSEKLKKELEYADLLREASNGYSWYLDKFEDMPEKTREYTISKIKKFRHYINKGKSKAARQILEDKKFTKTISKKTHSAMSATLATLYFIDGYDKQAIKWSYTPCTKWNNTSACWFGGLAAWRIDNLKRANEYFSKASKTDTTDEWLKSASHYWAYRTNSKLMNDKQAQKDLQDATKYSRTFYGILANYQLGIAPKYTWTFEGYINDFSNKSYMDSILSSPPLKRAIILASIGEIKLANREISNAYNNLDDKQKEVALFISKQYKIYPSAIQIANDLKDLNKEIYYDYINYPLPNWKKKTWLAEQPLVLAFIHQESAFFPEAKSYAGARGLMQIMPDTAAYVMKDKKIKSNLELLYNPEYNLKVGQDYINYLLAKPYIDGNLFFLATAYNAGPGNLLKWKKNTKYNNDPLLFIEAIPSRQTRIYIERVLANYWIYSYRLEQDMKSLDQVSSGNWPSL